eukprot:scaffold3161_cov21-Tisochrysis_lutea.AAC.4
MSASCLQLFAAQTLIFVFLLALVPQAVRHKRLDVLCVDAGALIASLSLARKTALHGRFHRRAQGPAALWAQDPQRQPAESGGGNGCANGWARFRLSVLSFMYARKFAFFPAKKLECVAYVSGIGQPYIYAGSTLPL